LVQSVNRQSAGRRNRGRHSLRAANDRRAAIVPRVIEDRVLLALTALHLSMRVDPDRNAMTRLEALHLADRIRVDRREGPPQEVNAMTLGRLQPRRSHPNLPENRRSQSNCPNFRRKL
jgi:hypothetical protein